MNTKNLVDINKEIVKAIMENAESVAEAKFADEDLGYEDVKHYNLDTKGSIVL